jgi:uncharacterized membrane protein
VSDETKEGPALEPGSHDLPAEAYTTMTRGLRVGLVLALAVLGSFVALYLALHPGTSFDSVLSANPIARYVTPGGLAAGLLGLHVEAFLTVGMLLLIATPVSRVFTGFYYFHRQRQVALAKVTLVVFLLLLLGLFVLGPVLH